MPERKSEVERATERLNRAQVAADKARFRRLVKLLERASGELTVQFYTSRHNTVAQVTNSAIGSAITALNEILGS